MKVLISPGFGAGWSTWNHPLMAFDKDVIELFERGGSEDEIRRLCADKGYGGDDRYIYMGGFDELQVVEVPSGNLFKIEEYDGSEYIEIFDADEWYPAEGEYYEID